MKAQIFYMDDAGNVVPKEKATKAIIRETDDKGNLVQETFANIN